MGNRYDKDLLSPFGFLPFLFGIPVIFQVKFEFKINIPRLPHTFHVKRYDMYDWAQKTYHPNTVHLTRYDWKTIGKDKKLKNVSQHLQRDAKWFRYRVSIHHPLGFNWHPFEGPGRCWFMFFFFLHLILLEIPVAVSMMPNLFDMCLTKPGTFWCFFGDF